MNSSPSAERSYHNDMAEKQKEVEAKITEGTKKMLLAHLEEEARRKRNNFWCAVGAIAVILVIIFVTVKYSHADIVSVARQEIGKGEFIFDNYGPDVAKYMQGRQGLPWCAGFVSYCASKSGLSIPYTLRSTNFLQYGKHVKNPQPGDIAVFSRDTGGHVGIVERVEPNRIITIEGNTGKAPSKVKRIVYQGTPKNLMVYVRLTGGKP